MTEILEDNPALGIFFSSSPNDDEPAPVTPDVPTPVTTAEPTPANVDIGDVTVKLLTCNVQNTPDLSRANVKKTGKAVSGRFTIGGFQELGEAGADRADVLAGLGSAYKMTSHGNVNVQTQIAYKDVFRLGKGGYIQAVPGGQPYPNPERGWVWQEFIPEHGPQFTFADTHMVNKAWNAVPDEHKGLRKQNWSKHYNLLMPWCIQVSRAQPLILVGDFNRLKFSLPPNARMLAGSTSIDKIILFLPEGYRYKATGPVFTIGTPSDHDAKGVEGRLERKRAS